MRQNEVLFDRPPTTGPVGLPLRTSNRATAPRCQWLCVGWKRNVPRHGLRHDVVALGDLLGLKPASIQGARVTDLLPETTVGVASAPTSHRIDRRRVSARRPERPCQSLTDGWERRDAPDCADLVLPYASHVPRGRKKMGNGGAPPGNDDDAPGWDALDSVFEVQFPRQSPHHWKPNDVSLPGQDGVWGISAYRDDDAWFYVTYGLTDLFESFGPSQAGAGGDGTRWSGFGFELTMRVLSPEAQPPLWPVDLLEKLGKYVYQTKSGFGHGHRLDPGGPITGDDPPTRLTALAFAIDPVHRTDRNPLGSRRVHHRGGYHGRRTRSDEGHDHRRCALGASARLTTARHRPGQIVPDRELRNSALDVADQPPASFFCVSASFLRFSMFGLSASLIDAIGGLVRCFFRGRSARASARASMRAAIVTSWPWSPGT